jgi:hypothetical protein
MTNDLLNTANALALENIKLAAQLRYLREAHAELLAAAKEVLNAWEGGSGMGTLYEMARAIPTLRAAIAAAEEPAP